MVQLAALNCNCKWNFEKMLSNLKTGKVRGLEPFQKLIRIFEFVAKCIWVGLTAKLQQRAVTIKILYLSFRFPFSFHHSGTIRKSVENSNSPGQFFSLVSWNLTHFELFEFLQFFLELQIVQNHGNKHRKQDGSGKEVVEDKIHNHQRLPTFYNFLKKEKTSFSPGYFSLKLFP